MLMRTTFPFQSQIGYILCAGVLACIDCNKRKADRTPRQAGMNLKQAPRSPTWRPVYADHRVRLDSWAKFISEAYWNVELEK